MSSELAKGLLVASCILVIVSAGFMMFSAPSNADMASLDVYMKCQACGEVESYTLDDFAVFARKQFDEFFDHCIVCNEPRLKTEFVRRKSGYKCPGCIGMSHKRKTTTKCIEYTKCDRCGKMGQLNDFYRTKEWGGILHYKTVYLCRECF